MKRKARKPRTFSWDDSCRVSASTDSISFRFREGYCVFFYLTEKKYKIKQARKLAKFFEQYAD